MTVIAFREPLAPDAVSDTGRSLAASLDTIVSHLEFVLAGELGPLGDGQRRFLELPLEQARRALAEAHDLRRRASASADRAATVRTRCDLTAVVEQAVRSAWPIAFAKRLKLDVRAPDPCWIESDDAQLERALFDLLDRAIDAAPVQSSLTVLVGSGRVEIAYPGAQPPAEGNGSLERLEDATLELVLGNGFVRMALVLGTPEVALEPPISPSIAVAV